MNKICGIYMLTNLITNERYVGQSRNVLKRINQHKNDSKKASLKISKAITEYGFENFGWKILEECSQEELDHKERDYIARLKPEYNVFRGGKGPNGHKLSDEDKERSRQAAKKQWLDMTDEQREYVIKHNLVGPRKGHPVSEQTRAKLRQHNLGKKQSAETIAKRVAKLKGRHVDNSCHNKKIMCIETGQEFPSIKIAGQWLGKNPSTINVALKNGNKTAGGYHWEYANK